MARDWDRFFSAPESIEDCTTAERREATNILRKWNRGEKDENRHAIIEEAIRMISVGKIKHHGKHYEVDTTYANIRFDHKQICLTRKPVESAQ